MSSGHHSTEMVSPARLARVLRDPRVLRALARPWRLDLNHDVPYLAGYSKDGHTIFIDRHMPPRIMVGDRLFPAYGPLITHERTEKAVRDVFGWDYDTCHQFANRNEHMRVATAGRNPDDWELALDKYIKFDELEELVQVPLDLDLFPYSGEMLAHLLTAQAEEAVRDPKTPRPRIEEVL